MAAITISRLYGSGGGEVARRVAAALGWPLLDNAFVEVVAQRLGVSPAEVEAREERVPTLAQRIADSLALGAPELMPASAAAPLPPSEDQLVEMSARIVLEAVARGPAVIVGRGAQSILATRGDVLHALCHAPRPALVARVANRLGLPPREAERLVDETNHQREQYVKKYWGRRWLALENYQLCLDTEWLGVEGTTELIVRVARERLVRSEG